MKSHNYHVSSTETGEDVVDVFSSALPNLISLTAAGNPFYQDVRMHFTALLNHYHTSTNENVLYRH